MTVSESEFERKIVSQSAKTKPRATKRNFRAYPARSQRCVFGGEMPGAMASR
jgi:hypothetical protein